VQDRKAIGSGADAWDRAEAALARAILRDLPAAEIDALRARRDIAQELFLRTCNLILGLLLTKKGRVPRKTKRAKCA
jgi:hypothetical protein